ncbi:helix-turn-helix domain-containing protein [Mycolicibacillus parakoreensis]|nr:helix-turn-helix domain-containing protein [Mycolicibacillus parakoreensis]
MERIALSPRQVADLFGCCEKTVRRYIAQGLLPAHRLGPRFLRIYRDDAEALLMPTAGGSA